MKNLALALIPKCYVNDFVNMQRDKLLALALLTFFLSLTPINKRITKI
jgi:hypothetical protein